MKDKDSVKLLLETIQELYNPRDKKPIVNYKDYEWYFAFNDVKQFDSKNKYVKFHDDNDAENVFSITKPSHESCPAPGDKLSTWLKRGWEKYQNKVEIIETINDEKFNDDENRITIYEEWNNKRQIWADEEYNKEKILTLFNKLSNIIDDFKLDYDKQELLVSAGLVSAPQIDEKINYPLFTQKVNIKFDNDINTVISVYLQDTDFNVETKFLSELENTVKKYKENNPTDLRIINIRLPEILDIVYENDINILNETETKSILKKVVALLTDNGKLVDDNDINEHSGEYFLIKYSPVLIYRKRTVGLDDFIERINNSLNISPDKIPNHFINLLNGNNFIKPEQVKDLTTKEKIAKINGTFEDVLLTKPSNQEQLRIIHEINRNDVVEVQGPPGTGKTHTIANLLGHFLAQGKRVLVVSEKTKALEVIQDKLETEIRDLCVPVLYGNNEKLKKAIGGIINKNASESLSDLEKKATKLDKQRKSLIDELQELQFNLFTIRNKQTQKILFRQQYYSLVEIGKFTADNKDKLSLIPGDVSRMDEMPVSQEEIQSLFEANDILTPADEKELALPLPSTDELPDKEEIQKLFREYASIKETIAKIETTLNGKIKFVDKNIYVNERLIFSNPEINRLEELEQFIKNLPELEDWFINICLAYRQASGYAETWKMLSKQIGQYLKLADEYITLSYATNIQIQIENSADINELLSSLDNTIQKYADKSGFGFFSKKFDSKLKYVLSNIKINNSEIKNTKDCTTAKKYLLLEKCKTDLRSMWNKSFKGTSMQSFDDITVLKAFENVKKQIDSALVWFDEIYTRLITTGEKAHINSALISFDNNEYRTEEFKNYYDNLKTISVYVNIAKNYINLNSIKYEVEACTDILNKESASCEKLFQALTSFNYEDYCKAYDNHTALLDKRKIFDTKKNILKKLKPFAADWANVFETRENIYDSKINHADFDSAWKVKQFEKIFKDIYEYPEDELVDKINDLTTELYKLTTNLVCTKAWFHNLSYCRQDSSILPSLNHYIQYNKKIGAGKGKYADDYRKAAQKSMIACQSAVPAWIMSVSEAINRFDPAYNHFDIMIIDEASQSSLNVLILTYLADKLIVVGDDKQVSPLAIGNDMQRQQDIVDKKLKGILKEPQLFRTDTSFYDLMANVSVPIMLREHFRCMPEIIGYCNKYFYDGKIRPLRDGNNNPIKPSIINFPVEGTRDKFNKINDVEAKTIVAIIKSCLELDEYSNKTFGVISLLGTEQSEYIRKLLSEKVGSKVMEERNILCGEPPSFQGDERDIILLSMVDDQDSVRTITKTGNRGAAGQRYNVAVSRAKDQVWIVNSLNYNSLRKEDIRHELLDYAEHSSEYLLQKENIAKESDSPFEEEVASYLLDHGYHIRQQYPVGSYRIDIIVFYQNNRIAIECDGERYHSDPDKVLADMEREEILKRIGNWKFIRIRGGIYYKDKKLAMENVIKQLEKNKIYPENNIVAKETDTENNALFIEVKRRVQQKLNHDKLKFGQITENFKVDDTISKDTDLKTITTKVNMNNGNVNTLKTEITSTKKISLKDTEKEKVVFKSISSETWFKLSTYEHLNGRSKHFAYNMGKYGKQNKDFEPTERQLKFGIDILKNAQKYGFKFSDDINDIVKTM